MSLKARLIASVVLIHTLLMGYVLFDLFTQEYQNMRSQLVDQGYEMVSILASQSRHALLRNDLVALQELIDMIKQSSDVRMVFILDRYGKVKASEPIDYFGKQLVDSHSVQALDPVHTPQTQVWHDGVVDTMGLVVIDGNIAGSVRVILESAHFEAAHAQARQEALWYMVLAVALGGVVAWIAMSRITLSFGSVVQAQKHLQNVIDGIEIPIMVIQRDYTVSLLNAKAQEYRDNRFIADPNAPKCYELSHQRTTPCDGQEHPCPLREALQSHTIAKALHVHVDGRGVEHTIELSMHPIFDKSQEVVAVIETAYDVTSLIEAQENLRFQANHDVLTGLPNRLLFMDRLHQAIKRAKRENHKIAVLFLDLDHFKEINDSLGHHAGDLLLKEVAKMLESAIRGSDTVARLGGDEFTILVDNLHTIDAVGDIIQKIMSNVKKAYLIADRELYMSFSIGTAIFPEDANNANILLKNADAAMYQAKAEGRNTYRFYTHDMTTRALERVTLESAMRQALERQEFEVYYQPQICTSKACIDGAEALVRWNHPTRGVLLPNLFIALAEETGLIKELDRWVMKSAMQQIVEWKKASLPIERVAINLSALEFNSTDFVEYIRDTLHATQCQPQWIEFEMTESQIMRDPQKGVEQLRRIGELGIEIAIDDFGTGYSSLAYLKKLPINTLKIDKCFIDDVVHNESDQEITRTIIAMAKNLKLNVIAEGVETHEQRDFLHREGCDMIQGYVYYRPMDASSFTHILHTKGQA